LLFPAGRAVFGHSILLFSLSVPLHGQLATGSIPASPGCADLLQAQDSKAVPVCKAQVDDAEKSPPNEHMARIIADDNYGVALLAVAHQPGEALKWFDRAIALLPVSTVKPDSLQWAVAFWHRATAYQQLLQWDRAASDLSTTEGTFTRAIAAATGDESLAQHFSQLRQRVLTQHADMLNRLGKRSEAQKILATQ
jgi:hypothetical protein